MFSPIVKSGLFVAILWLTACTATTNNLTPGTTPEQALAEHRDAVAEKNQPPRLLTTDQVSNQSQTASTQSLIACTRNLTLDDVVDGTVFDELRAVIQPLTANDLSDPDRARLRNKIPRSCYPFNPFEGSVVGEQELVRISDGTFALMEVRKVGRDFYVAYARPLSGREALRILGF